MNQKKSSSALFWLAVLSLLIATGVHLYLTLHHFDLKFGASEGDSICNINQKFDCDSVNMSVYSEVLDIPIALWGAITNLALLLLVVWAKLVSFKNPYLNRLCNWMSSAIATVSVVMILISLTQLNMLCLFCIITYVTSFMAWIGIRLGVPQRMGHGSTASYLVQGGDQGGRPYLYFLAAIPVMVLLFNGMLSSRFGNDLKLVVHDSVAQWQQSTVHQFDTTTGLALKDSSKQYKMTIVEFADFKCPHCRSAAPSLNAFAKSRADVQLIFMNFPLDGSCNPAITSPGATCGLAKSVYCANQQGRGWEAHKWLFDHQTTSGNVDDLISQLQLDGAILKSCLESSATHDVILKQATQGKDAGVKGTPAVYVNGRQLMRGQLIPILEAAYNIVKK